MTPRGFTGQEHLDTTGLVHMNGRVYDPKIGRFLSADPNLQDDTNLQAYNRYSYVLNNPLSYTDPSGFFFKKLFKSFGKVFKALAFAPITLLKKPLQELGKVIAKVPGLSVVIQIAACTYGGPGGCAAAAALLTYASGGSLKDAAIAAAVAYVGYQVWQGPIGDFVSQGGVLAEAAGRGLYSGAVSTASGGSFKQGFIAGAVVGGAGGLASAIPGEDFGAEFARTAIAVAGGGAASELTGGNFVNGAATAAFASAFVIFDRHVVGAENQYGSVDNYSAGERVSNDAGACQTAAGPGALVAACYAVARQGAKILLTRGPLARTETGKYLGRKLFGTQAAMLRGSYAERSVLLRMGLTRNTRVFEVAGRGRTVPDAITQTRMIEIKDTVRVVFTRQLQTQVNAARVHGLRPTIYTGVNTRVSSAVQKNFQVIRLPGLGP